MPNTDKLVSHLWNVIRGDSLTYTFDTIAEDATITKAQITIKQNLDDLEDAAHLAVDSETGVVRLLGEAPTLEENTATFVVATGVLTIPAALMAKLSPMRYKYDIQVWRDTLVQTIEKGVMCVAADVTMVT
jgi:hypothetical protein